MGLHLLHVTSSLVSPWEPRSSFGVALVLQKNQTLFKEKVQSLSGLMICFVLIQVCTWKFQIDKIVLKISRIVGVVSRLRHLVPLPTLLTIDQSLIFPYLSYSLASWGQAAKTHLNRILILEKHALHLMHFCEPRTHVVPFYISPKFSL